MNGRHDGSLALQSGVVFCGLAVALGAFGAHGLELVGKALDWWTTAVQYQMFHGLALMLCAVLGARPGYRQATVSTWGFALGVPVFCGTLYAMALGAPRWLGAITPIGGVLLLVGWVGGLWLVRPLGSVGASQADPGV